VGLALLEPTTHQFLVVFPPQRRQAIVCKAPALAVHYILAAQGVVLGIAKYGSFEK